MSRGTRLAVAAAAVAAGCAAAKHGTATATVIRASAQCGGEGEGVSARWIASEGGLRAALGAGGSFGAAAEAPAMDFRQEGVLAVFMGQRRTGGYGLALHDPTVPIADGVGTVVIRFAEPSPGAIVTQVLTSPCLLVRIPRKGLRELKVVDPAGAIRATAVVPPR